MLARDRPLHIFMGLMALSTSSRQQMVFARSLNIPCAASKTENQRIPDTWRKRAYRILGEDSSGRPEAAFDQP